MLVNYSGQIFAGIYSKKNESGVLNRRKQDLLMKFNTNVFKDEYYVFYDILKMSNVLTLDERFIVLRLNTYKNQYMVNRNIDLNRFSGVADNYGEFITSCVALYKEFEDSPVVNDADFIRALEEYRLEYINEQSIILMQDSAAIMTDGLQYGRRKLSGFGDMQAYMKRGLSELDNLDSGTNHIGIFTYGIDDPKDTDEQLDTICKFGIGPLDEATGGITQGDMISILGVAKGGKSRFMTYIIHQCLLRGINCVVWSIENGIKGWQSLIRARHFDHLYNSSAENDSHSFINDNEIRKGNLDGVKKDKESASWVDLKTNKSYGRLTVIDEPFDIDTYIETLDAAVKKGSAQVVAVDYLQLIGDSTGRMNKNERIAEAYQKTLRYLKANKIAGLFPGQIKQSSVSGLTTLNAEELASVETRDIAGESYEVVKTPDINIALVGSVEDIKMGHLKLVSMPSRNSAPFAPVDLSVDFGASNFVVMKN